MNEAFDLDKFYSALDAQRISKSLTWKQVSEQSGVSASTLTRLKYGKRPDADGLASILTWSGLGTDSFLKSHHRQEPETLTKVITLLRNDRRLSTTNVEMIENLLKTMYSQSVN